ncbi:Hypothetical predicted protein [Podarcis lilfordi]|uniref:Uncharacterized protein n=1 Tax=Podarcis lilfordi TaxID=74358 RepID=A0AA35L950_9SAUR|nr:Hypothetical predicted protein [Podarcis lilfordi]
MGSRWGEPGGGEGPRGRAESHGQAEEHVQSALRSGGKDARGSLLGSPPKQIPKGRPSLPPGGPSSDLLPPSGEDDDTRREKGAPEIARQFRTRSRSPGQEGEPGGLALLSSSSEAHAAPPGPRRTLRGAFLGESERDSGGLVAAGVGSSWTNRERGRRVRRADGQEEEEEAAAGTPAGGEQATTLRPGSNQPGPARRGQQRAIVRHGAPLSPRGLGRAEPIPPRIFVLYLALAGTCLVLLILPLEGQPSPLVPPALHVTLPQKLVAAYVLGLLTMAFLRS